MTTDAAREAIDTGDGAGPGSDSGRPFDRHRRRRAEKVLAAVRGDAERLKRREVAEAARRLDARGDLTDEQRAAVGAMAERIVDGVLCDPAVRLRNAGDWAAVDGARRLFDLDPEAVDAGAGADAADAPGVASDE